MSLKDALTKALAVSHVDTEVRGVPVRVSNLSAADQLKVAGMSEDPELVFWILERSLRDPETDCRIFEDGDEALRDMDGAELVALLDIARGLWAPQEAAKN